MILNKKSKVPDTGAKITLSCSPQILILSPSETLMQPEDQVSVINRKLMSITILIL